jgi:hypothetical protein
MTGVFFLLLWNASALICYYAAELRDYTLALCFVSLACVSAAHIVKDTCDAPSKKPYLALLVCVSGAAYTHYFAALLVVIGCGILFLHLWMNDRRKVPLLLLTGATSILSFLPWVKTSFSVVSAVSENYFLFPATIRAALDFSGCVLSSRISRVFNPWWDGIYDGISFGLTLSFLASIVVFCRRKKTKEHKFALLLLLLFCLYSIFLVSFSFIVRNIMLPRYMLLGIVPSFIFVSTQIARIRRRTVLALIVSMLVASMVCNFCWTIRYRISAKWIYYTHFMKVAENKRPDDVFSMEPANAFVGHVRSIYAAFYPKSRFLYRGELGASPDGLGNFEHYSRVYDVEFVNVETLKDWSSFDSVNAYVFLWPDAQPQRFEQVLGKHAHILLGEHAHLFGLFGSCRLYRVSPASKLADFFNSKTTGEDAVAPP